MAILRLIVLFSVLALVAITETHAQSSEQAPNGLCGDIIEVLVSKGNYRLGPRIIHVEPGSYAKFAEENPSPTPSLIKDPRTRELTSLEWPRIQITPVDFENPREFDEAVQNRFTYKGKPLVKLGQGGFQKVFGTDEKRKVFKFLHPHFDLEEMEEYLARQFFLERAVDLLNYEGAPFTTEPLLITKTLAHRGVSIQDFTEGETLRNYVHRIGEINDPVVALLERILEWHPFLLDEMEERGIGGFTLSEIPQDTAEDAIDTRILKHAYGVPQNGKHEVSIDLGGHFDNVLVKENDDGTLHFLFRDW